MDSEQEPTITDEQFHKVALKIIFPVDVFYLDSSQEPVQQLIKEVIPQINIDSLQPHMMLVRGTSSPEGPYRWNRTLGNERAAHAFNYINRHLEFPNGNKVEHSLEQDYRDLLYLMKEHNDPQYRIVKSLVDKYSSAGNIAQLQSHLKRIDGGTLWRRLYKKYFPQLRTARVVLFFKKKPFTGSPEQSVTAEGNQPITADEPPQISTSEGIIPDSISIELLPEEDLPAFLIEPVGNIRLPSFYSKLVIPNPMGDVDLIPERIYRRHILGIRTNLLYDFFYMPGHYWAPSPNIQLEYYPLGGHITANLGFTCPYWHHWDRNQFWQIRDYVIEGRYYFKGQGRFIGPYASAYIHANKYGIGLSKKKGWEGEGYGAGALIGYTTHISKNHRWRLEFSLGLGIYQTRYDPYVYGNPKSSIEDGLYYYDYLGKKENFKERNHVFTWLGPTNFGVHLTYDLLFRRAYKNGVSFNRSELHLRQKGGAYDR